MFFFVFGLPGRFAQWCDAVTAELARRALAPTGLLHANTLAEMALNVIATGDSQAVVAARQPGGGLCAALVDARRNFIVALDDPRPVLVDRVLGQGVALADAVRTIASSCAALLACRSAPGALVLESDRDWPQPAATAAAIARHLRIPVDDLALAEIVAGPAADAALVPQHDAAAWWESLTPLERDTVVGALGAYVEPPAIGQALAITWTGGLFALGDRPAERAAGPVDITGRPRRLIEGPEILLPPGAWSLSLRALVTHGAAEHEFSVEICADHRLAVGTLRPQGEGRAELALDFAVDALTEHPITIRISSLRAAFDGTITLLGATLIQPAGLDAPAAALTPAAG